MKNELIPSFVQHGPTMYANWSENEKNFLRFFMQDSNALDQIAQVSARNFNTSDEKQLVFVEYLVRQKSEVSNYFIESIEQSFLKRNQFSKDFYPLL